MTKPLPLLMTSDDAASWLGITPRAFRERVRPALPVVRIGSAVRFARADVKAWRQARREEAKDDERKLRRLLKAKARGWR